MWKYSVIQSVSVAIQFDKLSNQRFIEVVLSPDVDGVLSTLFVTEYARRINVHVKVIGTYNGRTVRTLNQATTDQLKKALWLDLDVRFPGVACCIGQHYLGPPCVRTAIGSFNPNVFYKVSDMKHKYPFATCHFLFEALLGGDDFPLGDQARCAMAHADSMYWVATKYKANSKRWLDKMFPTSEWARTIASPHYLKTHCDTHLKVVQGTLAPRTFSGNGKRSFGLEDEILEERWRQTLGKQTCRSSSNSFHMTCVQQLLCQLGQFFHILPPAMDAVDTATVFWQGTKMQVEPSPYTTADLEAYLQSHHIRSHAWTLSRCISMTEGPPLGVPPPTVAQFF